MKCLDFRIIMASSLLYATCKEQNIFSPSSYVCILLKESVRLNDAPADGPIDQSSNSSLGASGFQ